MEDKKTQKRVNYTEAERKHLLQILKNYPILNDKRIDNKTIAIKRQAWREITSKFNNINGHIIDRTEEQLKKLWENTKTLYRKGLIAQNKEIITCNLTENPNIELLLGGGDGESMQTLNNGSFDNIPSTSDTSCDPLNSEIIVCDDEDDHQVVDSDKQMTSEHTHSQSTSMPLWLRGSALRKSRRSMREELFHERKRVMIVDHKIRELKMRLMREENERKTQLKQARMEMLNAKTQAWKAKTLYYKSKCDKYKNKMLPRYSQINRRHATSRYDSTRCNE